MKAAKLHRSRQITIEDVPTPELASNEVLIKVKSVGICGSDLHYWRTGSIGSMTVTQPLILGHECSGEIAEVGLSVSTFEVGDRVVAEPNAPCGKCRFCRTGRYNLCPQKHFMGDPPTNGAFAEYIAWPSDFTYKMPESMTFDEGALVEPLSIATYAVSRSNITPGDRVMIMGAGPIGLLTLVAVTVAGATEIYVADIYEWRLCMAREFGAKATLNPGCENVVSRIDELTRGNLVDVTLETSGSPEASAQAVRVTRRGGTIGLVGLYDAPELKYPLLEVLMKEISVVGNYDGAHMFPRSLETMALRKFDAKKLITHHLALQNIESGFRMMEERKEHVLKVQVHP